MIDVKEFVDFVDNNIDLMSGVPCTYFKKFLSYLTEKEDILQLEHLCATREDEAVGIATGAALSKKRALVYMQNSGLGNIGDALTSLAQLYKLPILLLISYRGLEDDRDFPEHSLMGEINDSFLDSLNLRYWNLEKENWHEIMQRAIRSMDEFSSPVVLLVEKGVLS